MAKCRKRPAPVAALVPGERAREAAEEVLRYFDADEHSTDDPCALENLTQLLSRHLPAPVSASIALSDGAKEAARDICEAISRHQGFALHDPINHAAFGKIISRHLPASQDTLAEQLAKALSERDAAWALNRQYHDTRQDTRNFAKNAQQQRDDWQAEAEALREDKAILDWLEANFDVIGDDGKRSKGPTLRDAARAAMKGDAK